MWKFITPIIRRFLSHSKGCLVKAKEEHSGLVDWGFIGVPIFGIVATWAIPVVPTSVSDGAKHWCYTHHWTVTFGGVAWLLFRMFWHSFLKFDELDQQLAPGILILWDRQSDYCEADQRTQGGRQSRWYRLYLKNKGGKPLQCSAELISIWKDSLAVWHGEKQPLPFSHGDIFEKILNPGIYETLDVATAVKDDKPWAIGSLNKGWQHHKSLPQIFKETGDYFLEIVISSPNLPKAERVLAGIHFDANFNEWPFINGFTQPSLAQPEATCRRLQAS